MEISPGRALHLCCVVGVSEGKPGDSDRADDDGDLYTREPEAISQHEEIKT
jgi:hypothetical protein